MADYDKVRMSELVSVQENDNQLVLQFQEDIRIVISIQDGKLQSQIS